MVRSRVSPEDTKLQRLFGALTDADRSAVLSFAEYLHHRQQSVVVVEPPQLPLEIPRPADENVPAALKRLRQTYPMLDASDLLAEASDLLSQYLMLGRAAAAVIDEMESLFLRHYQHYRDKTLGT